MLHYDIILIATCHTHTYVYDLMETVLKNNRKIAACLIVVNQDKNLIKTYDDTLHTHVKIIEHSKPLNTSVGRNLGIEYVIENKITAKYLTFPDDDSSFDASFFETLGALITKNDLRNFVIDVYCTGTKVLFRKISYENDQLLTRKDWDIVGAVNVLYNFDTFEKVGYFDVRFGVNATYGAGEDGDYFIRATQFDKFYYNNELYNYHPSGESKFKKMSYQSLRKRMFNYGKGGIALLCKHKMYFGASFLTIRAVGGVASYVLKGKFLIALTYFEAFFIRLFFLIKFSIFSVK
ncbi:glycosyltransferase family 2 protein [Pedobacter fastidiosus]|uniref:Glycosyltransferase, GT2 family n=1 Tax=Pedobacter fastidiosus TaxID=2765361 RepID=A0ABR7KR57_9SPHI|nr:hypothetical protein [Pedobacter fastidiosus]MBC6110545.1 hypothetical protein [Pedobacter fastidiosus]